MIYETIYGTTSLGALISELDRYLDDLVVAFDFGYLQPNGDVHSYRGFYDHLAIGYDDRCDDLTVKEFRDRLIWADGQVFVGYKGGSFEMNRDTPIWVAKVSEAHSTAIVGVRADCGQVIIETRRVDV